MISLEVSPKNPVIAWVSGGVTSAVACKLAAEIFGLGNCRFIFIDTRNEDDDTYRFLKDCEAWYGREIEFITNHDYDSIQHVWRKWKGLNFANGAICSTELKREVRIKWERENNYSYQVFGFDIDEPRRAKALTMNYPRANAIYPLMMYGLTKKDCIEIVQSQGVEVPRAYKMGLINNNCLNTGCVQGGIGYWQKLQRIFPEKYDRMAEEEHRLTDMKGAPVTMLKDQGKKAQQSGNTRVFLKKHPDYPHVRELSTFKGREPKPLMDCNGFCGVNDLERNPTENEIYYEQGTLDFN